MKKILIISYEFPPEVGGAGSVARDLAIGLAAEAEVHMLTEWVSDAETQKRRKDGYILHEVKSQRGIRPLSYWNYIRKLQLDDYHRIVINDARASMVASLFFSEKLLRKTIVYIHGREPEEVIKNPGKVRRMMGYPKKYEGFLKNSRKIVAVSRYMKEKMLDTGIDISPEKIEVIHNGIPEDIFYPEDKELKKRYNIPEDRTLLVSVSRIVKEKGYPQMADIFQKVCREDGGFHWLVAGGGAYLEELREKIDDMGLQENVTFIGGVERKALREIYSSGDLFWLLSNFDEALGLTYLEARFCGTPSLARNKSGERETIVEGFTGHLAEDDADAADYILKRSYLGLKDVEKYSEGYRLKDSILKMKEVLEI